MMSTELLNRACVLHGIKPEELAVVTYNKLDSESGHLRQLYHYLEGGRRAPYDLMRVISHHLVREYGYLDIAAAMLPDGYSIEPAASATNGSVDDELLMIMEIAGDIIAAARHRDTDRITHLAGRIIQQGVNLRAEAEAM